MTTVESEIEWIQRLSLEVAVRFLARLSWEVTIAGRNSYEVGTDELVNPRQLRRVNEIQHRVAACLSQLLEGTCPDGFTQSLASWVLAEPDDELRSILQYAWVQAKEFVAVR